MVGPLHQDAPYLSGNYAPVHQEISVDLPIIGEIPRDLCGVFARNGSNPRFAPRGRYHWFDGDGMVHAVHFEEGRARYQNRWVRTRAFLAEEEAGAALWTGVTERPDFTNPRGPFKDSANTDLVYHAGQLLCLWWLCGEPYVVRLPDLQTLGTQRYGGDVKTLSAHPKVDPETGEMLFMNYKPHPPYLSYGVIDAQGRCTHQTTIDLPGPRLQHDMAITARHSIFFDMSLMWDPELLKEGRTRLRFFRDRPSRIGVLPRHAPGSEIRWFEAEPFYMYHTINAWEEGERIVLVGCKMDAPLVGDPYNPPDPPGQPVPSIGFLRLQPRLHRWTLDLATGSLTEEDLDDLPTEFPRMNNLVLGRPSRYSYNPCVAAAPTLLFDGVVKYDTQRGRSQRHDYPAGWYGGEVVFAPRPGGTDEDDGYLVTFVCEEATRAAELYVLDARDPSRPPLARAPIPQPVPTGYHAYWISGADLAQQRPLG